MHRQAPHCPHPQVLLDWLISDNDAAAIEAEWGQAERLTKEGAGACRAPGSPPTMDWR